MLPFEISSIRYELTIHVLISVIHFSVRLFLSLGITSAVRVWPLNPSVCKDQTHFPASPKSRKSRCFPTTVVDQFCQTWTVRGTELGCIFHLLFTHPCLSHGTIFSATWLVCVWTSWRADWEHFHSRPSWSTAAWFCFPPHANLRMFPGHFAPIAVVGITLQGDDFRVDLPPLLSCEFLKGSYCFLFFFFWAPNVVPCVT